MSLAADTTQVSSQVAAARSAFAAPMQYARQTVARADEVSKETKKLSEEEFSKAVNDLNAQLKTIHTELNFTVDKDTNKMVVKVVNSETEEIIRQIPAEEVLRIASRISKLLGMFIDENV